jgi:hypothetical protein
MPTQSHFFLEQVPPKEDNEEMEAPGTETGRSVGGDPGLQ